MVTKQKNKLTNLDPVESMVVEGDEVLPRWWSCGGDEVLEDERGEGERVR